MLKGATARVCALVGILAWVLVSLIIIGVRFSSGAPVDTDIQSILPEEASAPAVRAAMQRSGEVAANRVAFLVTASDNSQDEKAADDLAQRLLAGGLFENDRTQGEVMGRWIFANRDELLCEATPESFDDTDANAIRRKALASVFGVGAPVTGDLLRQDPFLLTLRLSDCLSGGGVRTGPNETLISGQLTRSAYAMDVQAQLDAQVEAWRAEWEAEGVKLDRLGAVFHAAHSAESARQEISFVGGLGLLGVMLLFWSVFGRVRNILIVATLILLSCVSGLAATLIVFSSVHMLVLVFAAMLVGVVSDYAVHALAVGVAMGWPARGERLGHLIRPMTVSMLTTTAGFAGLAFLGVDLFRQLAVFAVVGVVTAWALVLWVLLPLDLRPRRPEKIRKRWQWGQGLLDRVSIPKDAVSGLIVIALLLALLGAVRYSALDDVRSFQPLNPILQAEERAVARVLGGGAEQVFLVSEGATLEEARRIEELALAQAPADLQYQALTRFDPSRTRRSENTEALETVLNAPYLEAHRRQIGLAADDAPSSSTSDEDNEDLTRPDWFEDMHVETEQAHYLFARLSNLNGWQGPTAVPGAMLVDSAAQYSAAFARYRHLAQWSLLVASGMACVFVLVFYRKVSALFIVIAPFLAMVAGILIPSAFGAPVSFFSMAGGMVLFGVGVDYSAFMWESGRRMEKWTRTSVGVGAVTTLLSMGLLAFSETFPVRSFGLTVASGVVCALIFASMPYWMARGGEER